MPSPAHPINMFQVITQSEHESDGLVAPSRNMQHNIAIFPADGEGGRGGGGWVAEQKMPMTQANRADWTNFHETQIVGIVVLKWTCFERMKRKKRAAWIFLRIQIHIYI